MIPTTRTIIRMALLLIVIGANSSAEDDAPPTSKAKPKSVDAQLLDDLDADLLEGLPAAGKPAGQQPAPSGAGNQADVPADVTDPLAIIGERMRAVQRRMANRDTSETTQDLQRQIQVDLAALIEQTKQQYAAGKSSGSGPGSQAGNTGGNPTAAPPRDSTDRIERGTKESVETVEVKDTIRQFWGHLPDKLREQLQSSLSEQFLPKYERLIEDYYRALAEERATP